MRKTTLKRKVAAKTVKPVKAKTMKGRKGYATGGSVKAAENRRKKYQEGGYGPVGSRKAIRAHQRANEAVKNKPTPTMLGSGGARKAADKIENRGNQIEEELKKAGG